MPALDGAFEHLTQRDAREPGPEGRGLRGAKALSLSWRRVTGTKGYDTSKGCDVYGLAL